MFGLSEQKISLNNKAAVSAFSGLLYTSPNE